MQINSNTNLKVKSNVRLYSTFTIQNPKVYDDCFIENDDGTVLSTCSQKKFNW